MVKKVIVLTVILFCVPYILYSQQSPNIEWQKCLGGSNNDGAWSIQQTTDKGYIIAGRTASNDGNLSGCHSWDDFWVVKLSSSGDIQWQK